MVKRWSAFPQAKPDPIFAIAAQARAAGPEAIDTTIGIYVKDGRVPLFPSVASAMSEVTATYGSESFSYPPLLGLPEFRTCVIGMLFGKYKGPIASIAATGGTGALALNLRMLRLLQPNGMLIIPSPSWANHPPLCSAAGIPFEEVPAIIDGSVDIEVIIECIKKQQQPCAVLFQAGCHNPTGIDLTIDQWKQLLPVLQAYDVAVLLDLAYQGFADGPDEDVQSLHALIDANITCLVAWSAAKNHSIYSLRTGLCAIAVPDEETKRVVEEQYSTLTRGLWSTAPITGQQVVACTQNRHRKEWEHDLAVVRSTLQQKRTTLQKYLPAGFHASLEGKGLFAMLPLQKELILRLRNKHKVFLLDDGRINIAGIADERIEEFCKKVSAVAMGV